MRKRKKFSATGEQSEEMSLQITSMADIFTIILVFLLKSYSSGLANVSPTQGVLLPEALADSRYKDALTVEIVRDAVLVDRKPAVTLRNYELKESADGISEALLKQRKRMKGNPTDSNLMLLADQRTPYETLKKVMSSAASAGYVDLQLAVVQAQ